MIIELRKYNEVGELLIENRTTGSQAQVSNWDVVSESRIFRGEEFTRRNPDTLGAWEDTQGDQGRLQG